MSSRIRHIALALVVAAPLPALGIVDPTRPPNTPSADAAVSTKPSGALRLSSIIVSPTRRLAVINGRTLRVGDDVSGARVVAIDPWAVHLRGSEGRFTLRLAGPPVKHLPTGKVR